MPAGQGANENSARRGPSLDAGARVAQQRRRFPPGPLPSASQCPPELPLPLPLELPLPGFVEPFPVPDRGVIPLFPEPVELEPFPVPVELEPVAVPVVSPELLVVPVEPLPVPEDSLLLPVLLPLAPLGSLAGRSLPHAASAKLNRPIVPSTRNRIIVVSF